ncbi:hypothetical protein CYLTODRAFT_424216 [Cylindrobasidium torrendii FP15055 ss-10]|uniref:Uncharacterized protein n=1 Tax=Cylindrobasidium torrendii FP15055 ss-10 TaxID=1314674 RepID=A0A0D7B4U4_9AGAR|nr:hypothetical protein CYLTODRAFT_424216 [Cylindrobasidium torrendii FP15055 ss-10]
MDRFGVEDISDDGLIFKVVFHLSQTTVTEMKYDSSIQSAQCGLGWLFSLERHPLHRPALPQEATTDQEKLNLDTYKLSMKLTEGFLCLLRTRHFTLDTITCVRSAGSRFVIRPPTNNELDARMIRIGDFDFSKPPSPPSWPGKPAYDFHITVELGQPRISVVKTILGKVEESFCTGDIANAKVIAYSRRSSRGKASGPQTFYAHASVLRKTGLKMDLLATEPECAIDLHQLNPSEEVTDSYDYESDSDIEEEDNLETPVHPSGHSDPPKSPALSHQSTLSQDFMEVAPPESEALTDPAESSESSRIQALQNSSDLKFLRMGRVIFLRSTAARTWRAFQYYAYFGDIKFSKLKSSYSGNKEASARLTEKGCSPKSMYRFADQFGLATLKEKAFKSLKSQLTEHNIVKETFSVFSSRYPEILEAEIKVLLSYYVENPSVRKGVAGMLKRLVAGETHIEPVLERVLLHGGVAVAATSIGKAKKKKVASDKI